MFIKICGITSEDDALLAVALGADGLGFVFAPGSPRQVRSARCGRSCIGCPPKTPTVGVFRDERRERVVEVVHSLGLTGAQLHGREHPSEVRWIARPGAAGDLGVRRRRPGARRRGRRGRRAWCSIDAPDPGSGRVFDWSLAEGAPSGVRVMLAGGLDADNVGDAIRRVRPWGVDVSTGVETEPGSGRKDPIRLRHFIEAAREAAERRGP